MGRQVRRWAIGAAVLGSTVLAGCEPGVLGESPWAAGIGAVALPFSHNVLPSLAPMLETVTPAVVNISADVRLPAQDNPLMRDPLLRRFFGVPGGLPERLPERRAQSAGSGVIVDATHGYILTNYHVVEGAESITVTLHDLSQVPATRIGGDAGTDLALLRISAEGLTALPFADSDRLRVGDFVVAIGNPFGIGQTVTFGIVSALGRTGVMRGGYEDFIQTDASINPGNSGGPLLDMAGRLVGINTVILSRTGVNIGIGFSVPSNTAREIVEQLVETGEVRRGRLGVVIEDVRSETMANFGLERAAGAIVAEVEPGSGAETAGLRPGDVILEVDGRAVETAAALRSRIGLMRAGSNVRLTVMRDGRRQSIAARLGS